jgi:hypothetical protein
MAPFYGDSNKTKILGTVNGKTFYWKIDTGSAVTCKNINAFETAFGKIKEGQKIQNRPFYKKEEVFAHSASFRRIQRKHPGLLLSTKILASL